MKLQNIKDVEKIISTAKLEKSLTNMFSDGQWAASYSYKIITNFELLDLMKFVKENDLIISISKERISIQ